MGKTKKNTLLILGSEKCVLVGFSTFSCDSSFICRPPALWMSSLHSNFGEVSTFVSSVLFIVQLVFVKM